MAQYTQITVGDPLSLSRNTLIFRYDVRGTTLYLDQTLSTTGFSGTEGVDWGSVMAYGGGGTGVFRVGARGGYFCLDEALDATGFSGVEDVNWQTIEKDKLQ